MRRMVQPIVAALCAFSIMTDAPVPPVISPSPLPETINGDACGSTKAPLSAVTWNVAMAPGMNPLYEERRAPVIEAIRDLPYDVLCIQEAWLDRDAQAIASATGLPPENVFLHETAGLGEDEGDICSTSGIEAVLACAEAQCADGPPEDATICAMERCKPELRTLFVHDRPCLNCLAAMAGRSVEEISRTCSATSMSRVYGGRNGVMLFSRWPLYGREAVFLPSSNANRVALLARVHVPGVPVPIEVACTHVSSPQPIPPFHSGLPTWSDEQRAQIRVAIERVFVRARGRPAILLGDLNFGAANGDMVLDYSRAAWDDLVAEGWRDPANEAVPPFCSVCGENNVRWAPGGPGFLFDHVVYRNHPGRVALRPACTDRLLDRRVEVVGHDGRAVRTFLSDHYAVRVKFGFE